MPFLPVFNRQFLAYFAQFQKMSDSVKFSIFHQDLKKTRFINFCDLDHMLKSLVVYQTFTKLNKKQYSKCWQMALSHISSVHFSSSVVSNSLQPHGLQHTRLPCPSPLLQLAQTHVHQVGDATQSTHNTHTDTHTYTPHTYTWHTQSHIHTQIHKHRYTQTHTDIHT